MPGARSRQGCDECRKRRRKCDEEKPRCGQCSAFNRTCEYSLRVVWQHSRKNSGIRSRHLPSGGRRLIRQGACAKADENAPTLAQGAKWLPQCLPNGIQLSPRYQQLLTHFTQDILASLSCHPSIHHDLGQGLIPSALESPQLMSACLALSAAGYLSRGVMQIDGVEVVKVLGHLQSSGLGLLRSALATTDDAHSGMGETLLATCLIWCLADVFTYRRFDGTLSSSWRIHLQGIRALLDRDGAYHRQFTTGTGTSRQIAMKHLYQLYLSLQTLPYVVSGSEASVSETPPLIDQAEPNGSPAIDGFLGYSDELLDIMHKIDQLSRAPSAFEADVLLGKVQAMIARDSIAAPPINLTTSSSSLIHSHPRIERSPLSSEHARQEFTLCHQIFQQATLTQLRRRLYHLPSQSPEIQNPVCSMQRMLNSLHTSDGGESMWVAMAMPVFTLGCEAFTPAQQAFVLDKVDRLEACIRSFHVRTIRQALVDIWAIRKDMGDENQGLVCAGRLLERLDYDIILF
ncbi:fungal-specific transcription factor domain-containing protein [Immersiella caudata]|uniref:Fungal-specific transcription factor domain-containing protein n=1 Tax=Immersiella caudata TaxID=314043 RepID=A0AA40BZ74_9PEZI|nr:fungal-specific transcription factor domain-containing protein [Immersiella caudata]